jgi:hypothetical protein
MAKLTWCQSNFNGGEWSPLAYGRYDLAKYKNGLSLCRNYLPTQQGGLTRRPGTRFVAQAKDSSYSPRLKRFEFSTAQAYQLEFGDHYVRVYLNDGQLQNNVPAVAAYAGGTLYASGDLVTNGGVTYWCKRATVGNAPPNATYWHPQAGTILEIYTPYLSTEIWQLGFTQSADTLYIAHPNYAPKKLQRAAATTWRLTDIAFLDGPYLPVNTTATALTPAGTTGTVNVVASADAFIPGDVGRFLRIRCGGVWLWGFVASVGDSTHCTWTISPKNEGQVPVTAVGTPYRVAGSIFGVILSEGGSGYGVTPPSVSITGGAGSGAIAYATLTNGVVTGVTMSVTGTGYTSDPAVAFSAPTGIVPSTTTFWRWGAWASHVGYPGIVAFHQDRLCWAGVDEYPGRIDASNSGDYENMAPTAIDGTVVDSSALAFSLNAGEVNVIQWMISDEWGLICGTAGGEWVVSPSNTQQAITQLNVSAKPLGNYGSAQVEPVRVGKATLFIQRTGRKLREMFYQFTANSFQALDISLVSEHLTKGGIKQMAVQLAPQQVVWIARTDGNAVGMTYDKDQDICGWHQHRLGGYSDSLRTAYPTIDSVSVNPAPGITRDEVWLIVKRYINGAVVRNVEVMAKTWEDGDDLDHCVFLDCSAEYDGAPTTTVTGLTWLIGETVGVLADGATHPDCVVSPAGAITLQLAASTVQVGLKYSSAVRTMRAEVGGQDGPSQGKLKRVISVVFRFFQSLGMSLPSLEPGVGVYPQPFRSSYDLMGGPPALYDGDKKWLYEGTWDTDGFISFETSDPHPSNITMLAAQIDSKDIEQ